MGEAKRRKQKDPNYGKNKKSYLTDTYNVFRIEYQDNETWLITNLELENRGYKTFPDNWEDSLQRQLEISLGISKRSKQCWVFIEDNVSPKSIVVGKLSHHPAQAMTKGFATLTIEKYLNNQSSDK